MKTWLIGINTVGQKDYVDNEGTFCVSVHLGTLVLPICFNTRYIKIFTTEIFFIQDICNVYSAHEAQFDESGSKERQVRCKRCK